MIDRDRALAGGASRQRNEGQPEILHQAGGADEQVSSIDGELDQLRRFYGACIEVTRRTKNARERAAAIRALRLDLRAAILAVTTRQRNEQASRREIIRRRIASDPKPFN
jgi:hypothetical protein